MSQKIHLVLALNQYMNSNRNFCLYPTLMFINNLDYNLKMIKVLYHLNHIPLNLRVKLEICF